MTAMNWLSMAVQAVSDLLPLSWIDSPFLFYTVSLTHMHTQAHLNNMQYSPLLIWFHPSAFCLGVTSRVSGGFPSRACGRAVTHGQLKTLMCVCVCENMHIDRFKREMWTPEQHLTLMSALLLILTSALLFFWSPPSPPQPIIFFIFQDEDEICRPHWPLMMICMHGL